MTFLRWAVVVVAVLLVVPVWLALAFAANAYVSVALPLVVAGAALLVLAQLADRRNRAAIHRRHCLECGVAVEQSATACPHCGSVRLEAATGGAARVGRRAPETREMPVAAFSPDRSGAIGWVDGAPPGAEGFAMDEGAGTRRLRIWGAALSALGVVLLAFGLSGLPAALP